MIKKQQLRASGKTIKSNICRLWGNIDSAARETGITKPVFYLSINNEEISNYLAGAVYKLGVDPSELVKKCSIKGSRAK